MLRTPPLAIAAGKGGGGGCCENVLASLEGPGVLLERVYLTFMCRSFAVTRCTGRKGDNEWNKCAFSLCTTGFLQKNANAQNVGTASTMTNGGSEHTQRWIIFIEEVP